MNIIIAIAYWGFVCALFFLLIFFVLFSTASVISVFSGIPFVGSQLKKINDILAQADPQEGDILYDLGSGDGRVVCLAAHEFKLNAIGVETNPILVFFSRLYAHIRGLKNVTFKRESMLSTDFSDANILYLFLFPHMLEKLTPKIQESCKPGTKIISHGFEIKPLSHLLTNTRLERPFNTYYYTL